MGNVNFDKYLDLEIEKYNNRCMMAELCSDCCGEPIEDETDICSRCGEHCSPVEFGEYMYDMRVAYEEDKADAKRDLERDK